MVLFLSIGTSFAQEKGELRLEGEYIENLVLEGKYGTLKSFRMPAGSIKLPAGEYRLKQVTLKGGYTHNLNVITFKSEWIMVSKDEPAVLKIGAPLKQTVEMKRRGRYLTLNYKLLGAGGESYTNPNGSEPPTFTVYHGDKEIAS